MKAIDVMVRDVITIGPDDSIADAAKLIADNDVSALPEPIALTPEQLKSVAAETAGGCGCVIIVIKPPVAGGIRLEE